MSSRIDRTGQRPQLFLAEGGEQRPQMRRGVAQRLAEQCRSPGAAKSSSVSSFSSVYAEASGSGSSGYC